MQSFHQTIQVRYHYSVHFTQYLFALDNPLLLQVLADDGRRSARKILCVIDRGVCERHPDLLEAIISYCQCHHSVIDLVCSPLVVPGGERVKNDMTSVLEVQSAIHQYGICRHSYVMAIGGGAVLDMVGYVAAIAHRGVRLIRVPTTVLSQNDSGVGVKNGVNCFGKKNFIGTFAPPVAVLNDGNFLTTLSARDWLSGISEAIKVALLKDSEFFGLIEQKASRLVERDMEAMLWLIYRCAQLHLDHITQSGDPFEAGSSRPLDFGHWAAHKLEYLSDYTLRHGEAVAIGIALDSTYSYLKGLLSKVGWQRILKLFSALGFAVFRPELSLHLDDWRDPNSIFSGLQEFREHLGGQLTIPLLEYIGRSIEVHEVDEEIMRKSIRVLEEYQLKQERKERQWMDKKGPVH